MSKDSELSKYAYQHSNPESDARAFIVKATSEELAYADMLSGRQVAGLLRTLVAAAGYKKILEIGMFTGYATLSMAEVLPESGHITTLEMNTMYMAIADQAFKKAGLSDRITVMHGNARETCLKLKGPFDLIFLDADKQHYPEYYKTLKPLLRSNGILAADNVFWGGGVLQPDDRKSKAIDEFNKMLAGDPDMETVMLDIRDGLTVARKR
jgi:caffeoyl-CoA O-methyltransferase